MKKKVMKPKIKKVSSMSIKKPSLSKMTIKKKIKPPSLKDKKYNSIKTTPIGSPIVGAGAIPNSNVISGTPSKNVYRPKPKTRNIPIKKQLIQGPSKVKTNISNLGGF